MQEQQITKGKTFAMQGQQIIKRENICNARAANHK